MDFAALSERRFIVGRLRRPHSRAVRDARCESNGEFGLDAHRLTNAYTESLNSLIRCANRAGRGYSFEALRAKILYTEGFHFVERPKWERRANLRREVSAFMAYSDSVGMMTPDDDFKGVNHGTDISTLVRRIESGQF